ALSGGADGWSVAMIAIATLAAAGLESLALGLDDNIVLPLTSAGVLFTLSLLDRGMWTAKSGSTRDWVLRNLPLAIGHNLALPAAAYAARPGRVSAPLRAV